MDNHQYLKDLIEKVNSLRKQIRYSEIDVTDCTISYMATKKTVFVGYKEGYYDLLRRKQKGLKESDKLRPTAKNYLKFIKDKSGKLIQIDCYTDGELECYFQTYWIDNVRYLFPFSPQGGNYFTYAYATRYQEDFVAEEYMVEGRQIVYESYSYQPNKEVEYEYINYVPSGDFPVIEEKKGRFCLSPFTYEEYYCDTWMNHVD